MSATEVPPPPTIRLIDGRTEFRFATRPAGQWPPLTGVVRPASVREVRAHDARCGDVRAKLGTLGVGQPVDHDAVEAELVQLQAAFYASRLLSWNVDAAVGPATVAALPWELFRQIDAVVAGTAGLLLGNSDATSPS